MKTVKSETKCFPIKRNRVNDETWFPIGYSFNVHDLGLPSDPPDIIPPEWENGNIEYLIDNGIWWFNTMYTIPHSNYPAWGEPIQRIKNQWTTTKHYERLLDYCLQKKEETSGKIDIRPMVWFTDRTKDFDIRSAGTWPTIPEDNLNVFIERVKKLCEHPMLGAWVLSDEPFAGDAARKAGKRSSCRDQLRYLYNVICENDKNILNHMIFNIIRGDGNFHFPDPNKPSIPLLDDLNGIGDYIIDDLYLYDFIMAVKLDKNYMGWAKTRTENAVKNITEIIKTTPTYKDRINKYPKEFPPIRDGFICLAQGTVFDDVKNPSNPLIGGEMTEDQIRYQVYTQWVNGAQGAMFWNLSKANERMFNIVKKVSYEAYKCSNYLMNPPDDICKKFQLNVTQDHCDVQLLVRKDPKYLYGNRYLIIIVNNSKDSTEVNLEIPSEISKYYNELRYVVHKYGLSNRMRAFNNKFKTVMDGYSGQAFILTEENNNF